MANIQGTFLAWQNWVDLADTTFHASQERTDNRVVANLSNAQSDDVWRVDIASGATSATATITLSQPRSVQLVTLQFPRFEYPGVSEVNPNFAKTDTIRIRLLDANENVVFDSTAQSANVEPGYMVYYVKLNAAVDTSKCELTLDAPSRVTQGFLDVGNLGLWPIWEPQRGFAYPASYGWVLNTENAKTPAGRLFTNRFDPFREWSLTFDTLTNQEAGQVEELIRYSGGARQVFVRRGDLEPSKDAMLCVVTRLRPIDSRTATLRQFSGTFEEFI
ncbi:MAG: hypothetical protein AAF720_00910 [Pseudomonadota bacterium]